VLIASPIPLAPPVTSATCPSMLAMSSSRVDLPTTSWLRLRA
jgi:hypothetical protein